MPSKSESQRLMRTGQPCCCQATCTLPAHALQAFLPAQGTDAHVLSGQRGSPFLPHILYLFLHHSRIFLRFFRQKPPVAPSYLQNKGPNPCQRIQGSFQCDFYRFPQSHLSSPTPFPAAPVSLPTHGCTLHSTPGSTQNTLWAFADFIPPA